MRSVKKIRIILIAFAAFSLFWACVYLDAGGKDMPDLRNFLIDHPLWVFILGIGVMTAALIGGRKVNILLLIAYAVFIGYMTLMYRNFGDQRASFELFGSYRRFFGSDQTRLQILNNIWLFAPLGTILYRLRPKWYMILIPLIASVGIELTQYFTGLGYCEADDMISNGLGGLIGWAVGAAAQAGRKNQGGKNV